MSEALKRAIAASPPGTLFTREGLLEVLAREEASEPRPLEWLDLKAAAAILGTDERKLRRMCARWERERAAGRKPKVRVRRRGMAPSSPWLLCEDDVWALRRERGPVRIVDGNSDDSRRAEVEAVQFGASLGDLLFREQYGSPLRPRPA